MKLSLAAQQGFGLERLLPPVISPISILALCVLSRNQTQGLIEMGCLF